MASLKVFGREGNLRTTSEREGEKIAHGKNTDSLKKALLDTHMNHSLVHQLNELGTYEDELGGQP